MSPFVEKLKKMNREVLYMTDAIDEYALQHLKEYKGKKLVSVTRDNLKLDDDVDPKDYDELCKVIKEKLADRVEKVQISSRIVDSPCCLVTGEFGWSANMERIMKAQALGDENNNYMVSKKIMEINPSHNIIRELKKRLETDKNDKTILPSVLDLLLIIPKHSLIDYIELLNWVCLLKTMRRVRFLEKIWRVLPAKMKWRTNLKWKKLSKHDSNNGFKN